MTGARIPTLRAVDIANAALMEVGLEPVIFERWDPTRGAATLSMPSTSLHTRAAMLGHLATRGPDHLVRCGDCGFAGIARGTVPCVTVRDALRGITCTSEAKP